jgi:hypothetical protein
MNILPSKPPTGALPNPSNPLTYRLLFAELLNDRTKPIPLVYWLTAKPRKEP